MVALIECFLNIIFFLIVLSLFLLSMLSTNLICWTCKGISNVHIVNQVQELIKNHKPVVVCLMEPRVDEPRVLRFCRKFIRWEQVAILAIGKSGGIIVLWKKAIGLVPPMAVTRNCLHMVISLNLNDVLSIINNGCTLAAQRSMWSQLTCMPNLECSKKHVIPRGNSMHVFSHLITRNR